MNWHETIEYIRQDPAYSSLVQATYIQRDLALNVENYQSSEEFAETLRILKRYTKVASPNLLDIGAGNGISSIGLTRNGFTVTALEPDPSDSIGAGAVRQLAAHYSLPNLTVVEAFGEKLPFEDETFDVVFARQAMHHAHQLPQFAKEAARVLKKGGLLLTVRDHVVKNEQDKQRFLKRHPLHQFYGGENAFELHQYKSALQQASLNIKEVLAPADSALNYSPWSREKVGNLVQEKVGAWAANEWVIDAGWWLLKRRLQWVPGRLYSFVAIK